MPQINAPIIRRILVIAGLCILLFIVFPILAARAAAGSRTYTEDSLPGTRVAIVFGAGLQRNGTPSAVLRDRVETAVRLYQTGKVEKLLMSGDNRFVDYNEPAAMRDYAAGLGIPVQDIVLDYAGRRTYDTCYRALHIFDVREAVLVTQDFHLTRALFTCASLGVESTGVPAEGRRYRRSSYLFWTLREIPATVVAAWEVWVVRPLPVLGPPEPIFSPNDAQAAAGG
jgi:SanA protein